MSDAQFPGTTEIEGLLADRQRLQEWLDRLESAAAPVPVRQRVRADYEGRLAEVVAQLRGHSSAILGSLGEVRGRLEEVSAQRADAEELRAESALRHTVGEYPEDQWRGMELEFHGRLAGFDGEISRLEVEVRKLEEVLALIAPQDAPARRSPGRSAEVHVIEQESVSLRPGRQAEGDVIAYQGSEASEDFEVVPEGPQAPRFTPKGGDPRPRDPGARTLRFPKASAQESQSDQVDEMTFIKSVTLESPVARKDRGLEERGPVGREGRGAAAAGKTLKCTECGTMNRPTEWYCERCGAELAAL
jgi:hypothetical protein